MVVEAETAPFTMNARVADGQAEVDEERVVETGRIAFASSTASAEGLAGKPFVQCRNRLQTAQSAG